MIRLFGTAHISSCVVRDDREAQLDGAGAAGHGDVGHGRIGVDERVDAVEGVAGGSRPSRRAGSSPKIIAARTTREMTWPTDQISSPTGTTRTGKPMLKDHLETSLLDDAADQEDEDAAGLIALDGLDGLFRGGSRPDHDDEAGDIAGDQRHAQLAHFGV